MTNPTFRTYNRIEVQLETMKADVSSQKRKFSLWTLLACLSVGGLVVVNLYFSLYSGGSRGQISPVSSTASLDGADGSGKKLSPVSYLNAGDGNAIKPSVQIVNVKQAPKVRKKISVAKNNTSKEWSWTFSQPPITCSANIVQALAKPRLTEEDLKFCHWALSPTGGKVQVGKSWGNLNSKEEKERFDSLNCNAVKAGKNPSCDDSWGDAHIRHWKSQVFSKIRCDAGKSENV
eukprot:gene42800-52301_t